MHALLKPQLITFFQSTIFYKIAIFLILKKDIEPVLFAIFIAYLFTLAAFAISSAVSFSIIQNKQNISYQLGQIIGAVLFPDNLFKTFFFKNLKKKNSFKNDFFFFFWAWSSATKGSSYGICLFL